MKRESNRAFLKRMRQRRAEIVAQAKQEREAAVKTGAMALAKDLVAYMKQREAEEEA
jgi:uncharacterized membrane protein